MQHESGLGIEQETIKRAAWRWQASKATREGGEIWQRNFDTRANASFESFQGRPGGIHGAEPGAGGRAPPTSSANTAQDEHRWVKLQPLVSSVQLSPTP